MDAVVYTSNTGFTEKFAELLGAKTGLKVFSLEKAVKELDKGSEVIYLGWLMAGGIKGLKKAKKHFSVRAVCAVGMDSSGLQFDNVRGKNKIGETPLFMLQGGLDMSKLKGIHRLMMKTMIRFAGRALSSKKDRTKEEDDILDLMLNGGNRVSEQQLFGVSDWYGKN